jgi:hypothetical protein
VNFSEFKGYHFRGRRKGYELPLDLAKSRLFVTFRPCADMANLIHDVASTLLVLAHRQRLLKGQDEDISLADYLEDSVTNDAYEIDQRHGDRPVFLRNNPAGYGIDEERLGCWTSKKVADKFTELCTKVGLQSECEGITRLEMLTITSPRRPWTEHLRHAAWNPDCHGFNLWC